VTVRTEHSFHYPGRHSALYTWVLEPPLTAVANRVVCVSETVHQSHAHRIPWMASRFVTIPNGISAAPAVRPREVVRADLGLGQDDRVALTAGGLTRPKAQHVLVQAFAQVVAKLPSARLLLAGEGPMRPTLEQLIREHGLGGNVRLLGSREDVPELLEAVDVFVLSSVREGLSMTLLEAMRAGRASVATGVGGNSEAIAVGETGLLVPPQDPQALAGALTTLLADREKARAWGVAARERWSRLFTAERMTRDTERIYWNELGRAAPAGATESWGEGRREAVR
jgi:glycosyltransferase involved in cell wall biosynthesis